MLFKEGRRFVSREEGIQCSHARSCTEGTVTASLCQIGPHGNVNGVTRARLPAGVGNLFLPTGHLDIYSVIWGPYKIINLKLMLL